MARAGWRKPETQTRLSDLVSVGLLTRVFPPDVGDEVIAECDRTEQRSRSLPARVRASFAMGMALHSEGSYEDVLALMTDGLAWAERRSADGVKWPPKSALFPAPQRRGAPPVRRWFARASRPPAAGLQCVAGASSCAVSVAPDPARRAEGAPSGPAECE